MAINSSSTILQFAFEDSYGTYETPMTRQVQINSVSPFSYDLEKKGPGMFTGGKGEEQKFTMSKKVSGSLSYISRPDDVGMFLANAFGKETVSSVATVSTHTFTLSDPNSESNPSLSATTKQGDFVFGYSGLDIDEIGFSASAGDYLSTSLSFVGKEEVTGTASTLLSPSALRPLTFASGVVLTVGGTELAKIKKVDFKMKNNLKNYQYNDTGYFFSEPKPTSRNITLTVECEWSSASQAIYVANYLADNLAAVVLTFNSSQMIADTTPYSLQISVPAMSLDKPSRSGSANEIISHSLPFVGVDTLSGELITAILKNSQATVYHS